MKEKPLKYNISNNIPLAPIPRHPEHLDKTNKDKQLKKYKNMIIKLWELLDDIGTASDIFKPKIQNYERYINKKCQERYNIIKSDGYKLLFDEINKEDVKIEVNKISDYNCKHKKRIPIEFSILCKLGKDVTECRSCKNREEIKTALITISSKEEYDDAPLEIPIFKKIKVKIGKIESLKFIKG